ncbi:ribonuclease R [Roseateles amylovorans]|uniref:Ribonuclease R n=1 Tax=Roseateles amylovorans TaxID=2978473 RepID=A0ABY6B6E8_9BURK|nr:ribonuclease R [Roseateles amylovorans]UXH80955.1 ribonuclease R [Roseateles amylovorans]
MGEVEGTVQGHRDGHGFLMPDDGQADVYLSSQEMHAVMHGDRLRVRVVRLDKRGRPEGRVLEILNRRKKPIIGRLLLESGIWLVAPEDKRYGQDILIPKNAIANATAGQIVAVELTEPPSLYSQPVGRVTEVLGEIDDPGMEIEIAVRKYEVPHAFSPDTLAQAAKLPDKVRAVDMKNRIDLRDVALVTIDGEDARDFDDAVYCEPHKQGRGKTAFKGWRLLVAIADVSHYVKPGEALDHDAYERATSVYFPRRVIPMLPEKLSNGLCSLNPDQDRLSMVCDMLVDEAGEVQAYQFYPAVINSHARLTYTEVAAILGNTHGPEAAKRRTLVPHLLHLHEVYRALLSQRAKRGAVDFETTETQIICDDNGRIEKIVPRTRNEAHRLIEEAMLAANVCAADFIAGGKHASLYRVHEGPTPEKRTSLQAYLRALGIGMGISDDPTPGEFQAIAQSTKDRPDATQIHAMLLRSMQQAIYTPMNAGHFGLAYQAYTHFTSPIRRYPDLLVHRVIKSLLGNKKYTLDAHKMDAANPMPKRPGRPTKTLTPATASTEVERWEIVGAHCSANERRADEASRDVEAWLKCRFMRDHLGEEFSGTVSAVTSFGLFVQLDALYVEGLIHITELGGEYFRFDDVRQELRGERTGIRYATGARVQVQVSRVDLDGRKIDFRLVREQDEARQLQRAMRDKHGDSRRHDKRGDKRVRREAAAAPAATVEPMPMPPPDPPTAVDALERIEQADRALKVERRKAARATKSASTHPVKAVKQTARTAVKSVAGKASGAVGGGGKGAGATKSATRRKRGGGG